MDIKQTIDLINARMLHLYESSNVENINEWPYTRARLDELKFVRQYLIDSKGEDEARKKSDEAAENVRSIFFSNAAAAGVDSVDWHNAGPGVEIKGSFKLAPNVEGKPIFDALTVDVKDTVDKLEGMKAHGDRESLGEYSKGWNGAIDWIKTFFINKFADAQHNAKNNA